MLVQPNAIHPSKPTAQVDRYSNLSEGKTVSFSSWTVPRMAPNWRFGLLPPVGDDRYQRRSQSSSSAAHLEEVGGPETNRLSSTVAATGEDEAVPEIWFPPSSRPPSISIGVTQFDNFQPHWKASTSALIRLVPSCLGLGKMMSGAGRGGNLCLIAAPRLHDGSKELNRRLTIRADSGAGWLANRELRWQLVVVEGGRRKRTIKWW